MKQILSTILFIDALHLYFKLQLFLFKWYTLSIKEFNEVILFNGNKNCDFSNVIYYYNLPLVKHSNYWRNQSLGPLRPAI